MTYPAFEKIPRFNRDVTITEKIDGTNALVSVAYVGEISDEECGCMDFEFLGIYEVEHAGARWHVKAGSRNRWLTPEEDNYGFAAWVRDHADDLVKLGPGLHYGEWYGKGIQRGYGLDEKRFALFNTHRWKDERPDCCDVVPTLYEGNARDLTDILEDCLYWLRRDGSLISPNFMRPEGVVIYHHAAKQYFKVLLENDDAPKGVAA